MAAGKSFTRMLTIVCRVFILTELFEECVMYFVRTIFCIYCKLGSPGIEFRLFRTPFLDSLYLNLKVFVFRKLREQSLRLTGTGAEANLQGYEMF